MKQACSPPLDASLSASDDGLTWIVGRLSSGHLLYRDSTLLHELRITSTSAFGIFVGVLRNLRRAQVLGVVVRFATSPILRRPGLYSHPLLSLMCCTLHPTRRPRSRSSITTVRLRIWISKAVLSTVNFLLAILLVLQWKSTSEVNHLR